MNAVAMQNPARDVSALFVDPAGPYPSLVADCWDVTRDARNYDGPNPVVAHPPRQLWVNLAHVNYKRYGGTVRLLEIEIPPLEGEEADGREWLVLDKHDGYVTFRQDYVSGGERTSWPGTGVSIDDEHIDQVIEALQRAKASHEQSEGSKGT